MLALRMHFSDIRRPLAVLRVPSREDVVLAVGALVLAIGLLLLVALPLFNRVAASTKLAAVKGNAATVQLAVESFARQHMGRYPATVPELAAYLPAQRVPVNPLNGKPLGFVMQPGDVTYSPLDDGRAYRIRAWTYGAGGGCRELMSLAGGAARAGPRVTEDHNRS